MIRRKNTFGVEAKTCSSSFEAKKLARQHSGRDSQAIVAAAEDEMQVDEGASSGGSAPVPQAEGALSPGASGSASNSTTPPTDASAGNSMAASTRSQQASSPTAPATAPAPPAADVEGAELGPNSRVDLLRARLKELHQPFYGTKEMLWTRLKNAEVQHRRDMAFKRSV